MPDENPARDGCAPGNDQNANPVGGDAIHHGPDLVTTIVRAIAVHSKANGFRRVRYDNAGESCSVLGWRESRQPGITLILRQSEIEWPVIPFPEVMAHEGSAGIACQALGEFREQIIDSIVEKTDPGAVGSNLTSRNGGLMGMAFARWRMAGSRSSSWIAESVSPCRRSVLRLAIRIGRPERA